MYFSIVNGTYMMNLMIYSECLGLLIVISQLSKIGFFQGCSYFTFTKLKLYSERIYILRPFSKSVTEPHHSIADFTTIRCSVNNYTVILEIGLTSKH